MHILWVFVAAYVSAIYVGWPMSEQLPNVARVGSEYSFTIASSTYKSSSGGEISYSASNLPSWLSFDESSRTFSGVPSSSDVETFSITLTGEDSADESNYTAEYSMLVSTSDGIELSSSDVMFTTIAQYGQTNGLDGLVVKQGQTFSIAFSTDVFELVNGSDSAISAYYGRSADRTPLPNWVNFDSDSYTFSGTVPYVTSEIAPSVVYSFSFIASEYAGYAGAEGVFKLVVGAHQLSTSLNETIKINGTWGSSFDYTVPILSMVYLDETLIAKENISSVAPQDLPSFVSFDQSDYSLTGQFPNSTANDNFTILVSDVFGNSVVIPYSFISLDSVFTLDTLPNVNATRGEFFSFEIPQSYFTEFNKTEVDVTLPNNSSWLSYNSSNMTLTGEVPTDFDDLEVEINADSSYGEDSRSFNVRGVDKVTLTSSSSSSASATSTSSSGVLNSSSASATATDSTSTANHSLSTSNHRKLVLGLAIGIPCFVALVAAILLIFCCCFRKKSSNDSESQFSAKTQTEELHGPGFGVITDKDDHDETPQQLSALNALKLDGDNASASSSLTHVDSDYNSEAFFDASEKPRMSWRANQPFDSKTMKSLLLKQKHASDISVDTVNTEQLFSVRLVDDDASHRNSTQSFATSRLPENNLYSPSFSNSVNIQRLDSDGNIVGNDVASTKSPSGGVASNLNNIEEEEYNNPSYSPESSDYNLMGKFLAHSEGSRSTSPDSQDSGQSHVDIQGSNNRWRVVDQTRTAAAKPRTRFLDDEPTPRNNAKIAENLNLDFSKTSIYSDLGLSGANPASNAKLVEFTRKSSLKDSARHQNLDYTGNIAEFDNDSD